MSMTFSIEGAPHHRVKCDFDCDCKPDEYCSVPVAPFTELNVSNGNAHAICEAIEYWGDIPAEVTAEIQRRVEALLNGPGAKALESPTITVGNITYCGRDEEYVQRRLTVLLEILRVATLHGRRVLCR